jgi:hypothetical protein
MPATPAEASLGARFGTRLGSLCLLRHGVGTDHDSPSTLATAPGRTRNQCARMQIGGEGVRARPAGVQPTNLAT